MAACTKCGEELFGGKVCYQCGARYGDQVSNHDPQASQPATPAPPMPPPAQAPPTQVPSYQPPAPQPQAPVPTSQPYSATRRELSVLSIVALVFAFVIPLAGIVLGHIALVRIRKSGARGRVVAIIALVVGYLSILGATL